MNFLLASTFNDSLLKLNGEKQKAVKATAFDLQLNPTSPGIFDTRTFETTGQL